ncbi:MAG: RusA family crossover junction endodeoxyribonuclease [Gammaproteobacteria bacterium]|nr:RusA family crossover junction endodeoxyribonuclease [Gammaproteobacteria bacterium]
MKLTLPFPPSINGYWRAYSGRQIISAKGREYRADVIKQMFYEHMPRYECEIEVHITLYPPDRRKRDIDNYIKAVFDAMTHAKVWVDDSQVSKMTVERGAVCKPGYVSLTVQPFANRLDNTTI